MKNFVNLKEVRKREEVRSQENEFTNEGREKTRREKQFGNLKKCI